MTLWLNKEKKRINSHSTNFSYLQTMTLLQMKLLKRITYEDDTYIRDWLGSWFVPEPWPSNEKTSMNHLISVLNESIMGL